MGTNSQVKAILLLCVLFILGDVVRQVMVIAPIPTTILLATVGVSMGLVKLYAWYTRQSVSNLISHHTNKVSERVGEIAESVRRDPQQADANPSDPIVSLKNEYVAGEISETEFERQLEEVYQPNDGETEGAGRRTTLECRDTDIR